MAAVPDGGEALVAVPLAAGLSAAEEASAAEAEVSAEAAPDEADIGRKHPEACASGCFWMREA